MRLISAVLLCAIVGVGPAFAQSSNLEAGVAARRRGDFVAAEAALRAAVAETPQSAEAWNALALVQGYQAHYTDALGSIIQAERLAPSDIDIALTKARILAWSMRYDEATEVLDRVRSSRPNNSDVLALRGRVAYYRGHLQDAFDDFKNALALESRNVDALLGLGDVARARGDEAAAASFFQKARAVDPTSKDVSDRLTKPQVADTPAWRLDIGGSYSSLARTSLKDWSSQYLSLAHIGGPGRYIFGGLARFRRFDRSDVEFSAGAGIPLTHGLTLRMEGGTTPKANFLPRWRIAPALSAEILRDTSLILEGGVRHYATGTVSGVNFGAEQFLMDRKAAVSARFINSFDKDGRHLTGWSAILSIYPVDRLSLRGAYSEAPESDAGIVAETRSMSAGFSYDITPTLSVRADFTHDNRLGAYIRDELTVGLGIRF